MTVFERKGLDFQGSTGADGSHLYPAELYEWPPLDPEPFGENIVNPDSRTIPSAFIGTWIARSGGDSVIFEPNHYQYLKTIGMQPVVAVRYISETEIAIVSQQADDGKWTYCLQYYGLFDGGSTLTDLESMDMKWVRA